VGVSSAPAAEANSARRVIRLMAIFLPGVGREFTIKKDDSVRVYSRRKLDKRPRFGKMSGEV